MQVHRPTRREIAVRIKALRAEGKSYEEIAQILGVSVKTVYNVVKGRTHAT